MKEKLWAHAAKLADVDEDDVQEPCTWPSRFCTVFLYLNDVENGGRTRFLWLNGEDTIPCGKIFIESIGSPPTAVSTHTELNFEPVAGTAIVHFPTTVFENGCIPDVRTMHESEHAIDEKYILQQFIWPLPIDGKSTKNPSLKHVWDELEAAAKTGGLMTEASPSTPPPIHVINRTDAPSSSWLVEWLWEILWSSLFSIAHFVSGILFINRLICKGVKALSDLVSRFDIHQDAPRDAETYAINFGHSRWPSCAASLLALQSALEPRKPVERQLHILGDSHARAWSHPKLHGSLLRSLSTQSRVVSIPGASARGLEGGGGITQAGDMFRRYVQGLPKDASVVCMLGEVDCNYLAWADRGPAARMRATLALSLHCSMGNTVMSPVPTCIVADITAVMMVLESVKRQCDYLRRVVAPVCPKAAVLSVHPPSATHNAMCLQLDRWRSQGVQDSALAMRASLSTEPSLETRGWLVQLYNWHLSAAVRGAGMFYMDSFRRTFNESTGKPHPWLIVSDSSWHLSEIDLVPVFYQLTKEYVTWRERPLGLGASGSPNPKGKGLVACT